MTESFVFVPSPTDAPEAALHSSHCPLVHQVDPSTDPERDPAMLCFADSGLAAAWAAFACALGTLHTQECNSFLPVLLQGEMGSLQETTGTSHVVKCGKRGFP